LGGRGWLAASTVASSPRGTVCIAKHNIS
jgi:hypothetical protein